MKFVDEAFIRVMAGKGGDGCLSFRREKFVPRGGPNGGDGGDGGDVVLVVHQGLNTLADFRHARVFEAGNGERGMGSDCSGKKGDDLHVRVPLGTLVYNEETDELIGDLVAAGQQLLVARGGRHGLGNAHFKSSRNRAPRKTTKGEPGEARDLRLEMRLLADVGLLGLPNAGKSTMLRQVSAARPKVADYPFTTLYPHLGVVRTGPDQSFVIADIPGLIEGAAAGAGLGVQFLRHLSRTRLLLHLLDMGSVVHAGDAAAQVRTVEQELRLYSKDLVRKERWLVFNKVDLIAPLQRDPLRREVVGDLGWRKPVFSVSAATGEGCRELMLAIQDWFDRDRRRRSRDKMKAES